MKMLRIIMIIVIVIFTPMIALAQKKVSHNFQYHAVGTEEGKLKEVTHVYHPETSSIRLYFDEVQLGPNSYLLLEGSNGVKQKLDAEALKNWRNSSAYFNGGRVKVSVYQAAGETIMFNVKELKVNEKQYRLDTMRTMQYRKINIQATSSTRIGEFNLEDVPYAAAVGRFTDGSESFGSGWIAPNGAIVTTHSIHGRFDDPDGFDVIEFNVPPSTGNSVNHPNPEDQYPLNKAKEFVGSKSIYYKKGPFNIINANYAIIEPLPNSTGFRPGERQQQYFRIATNPGSFITKSSDIPVEIIHYGNRSDDIASGKFKTLQISTGQLVDQNKYLSKYSESSRDNYILYNMDVFFGSDGGAPVVYQESNVAIGVHNYSLENIPSYGIGFKEDDFRNNLNDFFSTNRVYIDADGLFGNNATGEIHKPFIEIGDGLPHVPDHGILNISKGNYNEVLHINQPLTLIAPVGKVIIGTAGDAGARIVQNSRLAEFLQEEEENKEEPSTPILLKGFPNPFSNQVELQYNLKKESLVTIKIFNITGSQVKSLFQGQQNKGYQRIAWDGTNADGKPVDSGMYFIQVQTNTELLSTKLIKQ